MRLYPLSDELVLCESALFLPLERTLVVSDLQLGEEEQLRALGHNIPYEQAERMRAQLERLISQTRATRLVIDGDLKHEFGRISSQERHDLLALLRALQLRVEIVAVRGNHDTLTRPLTDELGIPLVDTWQAGGVCCAHGHALPPADALEGARTIVIGHMHPAVALSDGVRSERCKCFLVGRALRRRLIVLPSLTTITHGADVLSSSPNTPLLTRAELERCEIYAIADEIRPFGTVRGLRAALKRL